jgi:uncharacterized protein YutE (UPF0331/DUF86 family)/predicted nucleotidyltransferase
VALPKAAHSPAELASAVGAALSGVSAVRLAYLFGSRLRGNVRPDSDLDVGIVYDRALDDAAREGARRDILDALAASLGALGERADVVDLERAGSAIAFRAVRDGELAIARTAPERVRFVASVARRFDDDAPRRRLFRQAAIRAMTDVPVVDADVLARRILALNEGLRELERPAASDPGALANDPVLRAAVERWLQVSIEACLDIANHVIAEEGWTPPETGRASFLSLAAHGRIEHAFAVRLGRAVGLRNLLVHDYVSGDLAQLASIVRNDLGDQRTFGMHAAAWLARATHP